MADIEKVIKGLECCNNRNDCKQCPYANEYDPMLDCIDKTRADAIELLKEKQPRKKGHWVKSKFANDRWHQCSECGRLSERTDRNGYKLVCNYCRICGADMRKDGEQE